MGKRDPQIGSLRGSGSNKELVLGCQWGLSWVTVVRRWSWLPQVGDKPSWQSWT